MTYYIEKDTNIFEADLLSSDAFINCGNDKRKEYLEKYRAIEPQEMYQLIENANTWDTYDWDFYTELFTNLGIDYEGLEIEEIWEKVEKAIAELE